MPGFTEESNSEVRAALLHFHHVHTFKHTHVHAHTYTPHAFMLSCMGTHKCVCIHTPHAHASHKYCICIYPHLHMQVHTCSERVHMCTTCTNICKHRTYTLLYTCMHATYMYTPHVQQHASMHVPCMCAHMYVWIHTCQVPEPAVGNSSEPSTVLNATVLSLMSMHRWGMVHQVAGATQ